jgi:hypothetical protein
VAAAIAEAAETVAEAVAAAKDFQTRITARLRVSLASLAGNSSPVQRLLVAQAIISPAPQIHPGEIL